MLRVGKRSIILSMHHVFMIGSDCDEKKTVEFIDSKDVIISPKNKG